MHAGERQEKEIHKETLNKYLDLKDVAILQIFQEIQFKLILLQVALEIIVLSRGKF